MAITARSEGHRVNEKVEREGLDNSSHGETAYHR